MIVISLLVNILVLVPVCSGLITDADWTEEAYGPATPARSILLSIYLTIALSSAALLVLRDPKFIAALLMVQVIYKLTTPFTVGTVANPVVVSNIAISVLHVVTLVVIWRSL